MARFCIYCNKELESSNSFSMHVAPLTVFMARNAELAARWRKALAEHGKSEIRVVYCGLCKSLYMESPLVEGG